MNLHLEIHDAEIEKDIADTQQEVVLLEREVRLLRDVIAAKESGIEERRAFIITLRELQEARRA